MISESGALEVMSRCVGFRTLTLPLSKVNKVLFEGMR